MAVARRGGFRELVSRGEKGPIGITIKFRESGGRLATYELEIVAKGGLSLGLNAKYFTIVKGSMDAPGISLISQKPF